jgi:subtilisin family serine protease
MRSDNRVKIAVLDSGVDLSHPKIRSNIEEIEGFNPEPVVSKSFVGPDDSLDPLGHGTHITGTILSIAQGAKLFVGRVVRKDKRVDPEALAEVISCTIPTHTLL